FFEFTYPLKADLVKTMENNFTKNISQAEFAYLSGRSLAAFKRDFKKVFSESPGKWLKKKRLSLAHHLLKNTNKRPSVIYLEVGFEDYAHFSKSFKSSFGYSPSEVK
ncbi:MAG: AraC family transcriptional regulator, partial [Bacteroidota bacterium]